MFTIVFTRLNFEEQSCPIYHVLLISSNWLGEYSLCRNSILSTSHQVYLFSIRKWRTMCLSLLKEYEMLLEVLLFCHVYLGLTLFFDPFFLLFFFLNLSCPHKSSHGKSHRVDLFSRIQGMEEAPWHYLGNDFLDMTLKANATNAKKSTNVTISDLKLLHRERNNKMKNNP